MRKTSLDTYDMRLLLNRVEKPARYVGGEYGAIDHEPSVDDYTICLVFPDLYEIGSANQAMRILYKLINDADGFHAERAFCPAPDFGDGLKRIGQKLFSLENRFEVGDFDLLAVTIGYELSFTNFLGFLELSGIPVYSRDREDGHPLIIMGGPAMTNPAPWADFVDAVFIGEAEAVLIDSLQVLKKNHEEGASRNQLKNILNDLPGFWTPESPKTVRQIWMNFGLDSSAPAAFPIASMPSVQEHGVIEIMRGCPNKCRFCHAGVFYRPYRQKSLNRIVEEAEYLVTACGYREITLSSLSSGDYHGLESLVSFLNKRFRDRRISFNLPSLRVNSVALSLIGKLGTVRKSGLTFAVETPNTMAQRGINKEVPAEQVIAVLKEAKTKGWRLAKFYFMLGLPVEGGSDADAIVDYLLTVQHAVGINLNVNLGVFIPKPHTPFERAPQLTDDEGIALIRRIRDGLKPNRKIRFSYHSPFVSYLEGIISRGDRRAGELAYAAFKNGAQFDAWDDRMDKSAWKNAICSANWDVEAETCHARKLDEALPWDAISLGVVPGHFIKESQNSQDGTLTPQCAPVCPDYCGVCGKDIQAQNPLSPEIPQSHIDAQDGQEEQQLPPPRRILLIFSKNGPAKYLGHLDVLNVFEKSIQRAGFAMDFTQGFNPKPLIEFAQPLSLGVASAGEICAVRLRVGEDVDASSIMNGINTVLPQGFKIVNAGWITRDREGHKKFKIMSKFWGSEWLVEVPEELASAMTLDELCRRLQEKCAVEGVEKDINILQSTNSIKVLFRHRGTKAYNLKFLLEDILGKNPLHSGWKITRLACLAIDTDGENPVDYLKLYTEGFS